MSQLTANLVLTFDIGELASLPVKGTSEIFVGAAVGVTGGYARQLVAGDTFGGFSEDHVNNTGADGAQNIPLRQTGRAVLPITGAAVTDFGRDVYASDSGTFTYTATGNTLIGKVIRFISSTQILVAFNVNN